MAGEALYPAEPPPAGPIVNAALALLSTFVAAHSTECEITTEAGEDIDRWSVVVRLSGPNVVSTAEISDAGLLAYDIRDSKSGQTLAQYFETQLSPDQHTDGLQKWLANFSRAIKGNVPDTPIQVQYYDWLRQEAGMVKLPQGSPHIHQDSSLDNTPSIFQARYVTTKFCRYRDGKQVRLRIHSDVRATIELRNRGETNWVPTYEQANITAADFPALYLRCMEEVATDLTLGDRLLLEQTQKRSWGQKLGDLFKG